MTNGMLHLEARAIELSIVIPAYNEAERIVRTLEAVCEYLEAAHPSSEVVVVNDGSTDDTPDRVRRFSVRHPTLHLVSLPANRGKGFATRQGVLSARGDLVLCSDADLSTPVEQVRRLLERIVDADLVIGSRSIPGARIAVRQPLHRQTMGRVFNWLVRMLVVHGHKDTQCGFKLYRREAARAIFSLLTVAGFAFDVEVLYLAHRLGFRVAEVPVLWLNDDRSTVRVLSDPPRMFLDVARIPWRHRHLPREPVS